MKLPAIGTLSYNGITWDGYVQTRVDIKPIPDTAGRVTKMVEYKIHIAGWITGSAAGDADTALTNMRRLLTIRGGVLRFQTRGLGNIVVNDASGVYDLNLGPVPELLEWKPVGGAPGSPPTVYTEFTVTTWICPQPGQTAHDLLELCYDVTYSIDQDGLHTITVNGDLEIPLSGKRDFLLLTNADNFRERINFDTPVGFQRVKQDYKLSMDRKRLEFSIQDKELAVPLPNGVTAIDVRHRVSGKRSAGAFQNWTHTISGMIRSNPIWGKYNSLHKFFLIAFSRITWAQRTRNSGSAGIRPNAPVYIESLDIEEELFTHATRFTLTYMQMGAPLDTILRSSGLWRPIKGPDYGGTFQKWTDSLKDSSHHIRGNLRVAYLSSEDTIVNACDNLTSTPTSTPTRRKKDLTKKKVKKVYPPAPRPPVPSPGNPPGTNVPRIPPTDRTPSLELPNPLNGGNRRLPNPLGGGRRGLPNPLGGGNRLPNPLAGPLGLPNPIADPNGPLKLPTGLVPGGRTPPSPLRSDDSGLSNLVDPETSWLLYNLFIEITQDHRVSRHQPLAGTIQENVVGPDALGSAHPIATDRSGARFPTTSSNDSAGIMQKTSAPVTRIRLFGRAARIGYEINPPRLERYEGRAVTLVYERVSGGADSTVAGSTIYALEWDLVYAADKPVQRHEVPANPLYGNDGDRPNILNSPIRGK